MNETDLDVLRIAAIEARLNASTGGPWKAMLEGRDHSSGSSCVKTISGAIDFDGATDADIEFIANARQDVPYLVAELLRFATSLEKSRR